MKLSSLPLAGNLIWLSSTEATIRPNGDSAGGAAGPPGRRSVPPGAESARCLGAVLSLLSAGPEYPRYFPPSICSAHAHACDAQPGAPCPLGPTLPRDSSVACPTAGDSRHRAAGPGQSPDRLSVSRYAPAARAATVTAPRPAPGRAFHPVLAPAVERRLSQCSAALAGAHGAGAPAGTADGGALCRPTATGDGDPI
jgi:hypothetical protein